MGYRRRSRRVAASSLLASISLLSSAQVTVANANAQQHDDHEVNKYSMYKFPDDPSIVILNSVSNDTDAEGAASMSYQGLRSLQSNNKCKVGEALWRFDLFTDNYPWETSWRLFGPTGDVLASGPPAGRNYDRNQKYIGVWCITPGRYYLRMLDKQGDGLCCDFGNGKVTGTINGKTVVQSNDESFKRKDYYFNIAQAQTIGSPTTRPTQRITQRPTNNPTTRKPTPTPVQQLPTEPEVVVSFIMMGDVPYYSDHRYCLNEQLRSLHPDQLEHPYKFIVHVGDMKAGWTDCDSEKYSDVAQIFAHESNQLHYDTRDIFMLIGDNDWSDCDRPDVALSYFMNSFGNGKKITGRNTGPNPYGFGTLSDPNMAKTLVYDDMGESSTSQTYPSSASNFAFYYEQVLLVGINQVGGSSKGDESTRVANNFNFVKSKMAKHANKLKTVVIFAHAGMSNATRYEYFGKPFQSLLRSQYPDVFCLYAHGDWHDYDIYRSDKDNANLINLSCDSGDKAEPLLVSITRDPTGGRDGLRIDRRGGQYRNDCDEGNKERTWGSDIW